MREILIRPRAQLDIESIYIYLAFERSAPKAALDVVEALYSAFERIADLPESGRLFESDDLERVYRRVLAKDYWIYYTFDEESLTVWRIFHVRQDTDNYAIVDF